MEDRSNAPTGEPATESTLSVDGESLDATGAYETPTGVVLYDTEQPLAWIQGDNAVTLGEMR